MKFKITTLTFASAILLLSCKQDLQPQESLPVVESSQTVAPQEKGFFQKPTEAAPAVASAPGETAAGMNPPHGQPGHRCDIAVGAPLNSAPNPQGEVHPQPQVQPQAQPQVAQQPTKTAPGMNPPHGQPGHRCDIAVGAPLNSAPAKKTETATVAPKPASATITPASVPTEVAEGMNPPHGQPGHRCDIAVGQPLPKV